jgi:hypothetical protein
LKLDFPALVCTAVLLVTLSLGLYPFHAPKNEVAWLENRNALRFGSHGSLVSLGNLRAADPATQDGVTVEIWLQPRRVWDKGTFLAFSVPDNLFQLTLRQSQTALELCTARKVDFHVEDVFPRKGPVFVTISSGPNGTVLYTNGRPFETMPHLHLPAAAFSGRLIVGDSPGQTDAWAGQLYALAVYRRELTPSEILQNYTAWTRSGHPDIPVEHAIALYVFDEHSGRIVHNKAPSGVDLEIRETYGIVNQIFLEPVWSEFSMSESYWSSVLKNVVGFIPFGYCFFGYLSARSTYKRPRLTTVILGAIVSLTIEILQAYIPTRDSGTTDIFTNTFGTWIGVALYDLLRPLLARVLPGPLFSRLYIRPQTKDPASFT